MEYRFLIFGNIVSDYLHNKTFPRDIDNSDYFEFLKVIRDDGEDLIGGMYEDELVSDQELVLKPVPAWVQDDILLTLPTPTTKNTLPGNEPLPADEPTS